MALAAAQEAAGDRAQLLRASDVQLTDALKRDLEEVLARHGGRLDTIGHPTTTLEDYFLRIVEESKKHPGRRFLPGGEPPPPKAAGLPDAITDRP